jgi:serine/threonine protein kinase
MPLLKPGVLVQHPTRRELRYEVIRLIGKGGFGEAYEAEVLHDECDDAIARTCLKVTSARNKDDWHGEAYFMSLLQDAGHVVRLVDSFPALVGEGQAARMLFCIDMQLVERGSLRDALDAGEPAWPEARVARQIRYLLKPLSILHRMYAPHRDITPGNVFVGERSALLLGDYGIAKPALLESGVRADAFNPAFIPRDLGAFWSRSDDIYQVGLLAMTLLFGEVQTNEIKKPAVNQVTSKGPLRDVIKCALSVKSQRYESAMDMSADLADAYKQMR